ncbi:MAG TPA: selenocysteine-specific translation elongation factor [Candidatus Limnocylindria bacterium]|jgi:selenocysteine-specific elongation factor|nr:selenocysteine-specific translation elongation factor [Candidatus Limnocylindria bacterium]
MHRGPQVAESAGAGGQSPPIRVIATAGHVDHGKSTLITALTGIDPDRLREERERGMTIDLGFAWLRLPDGADVGVVDVPGHQDFIRNMLAGVGPVDAVLLVVALDEGVMPQTREHLAILGILGVDRGVVALTKRDLVDDEWASLARGDVTASLRGTPLAAARQVEVSALARRGLDELVAALGAVLGTSAPRRDLGRPRLPIDRAFTLTGFGTVVTGTLVDGAFTVGDEVEVLPSGRRARIRGIQTHKHALDAARPGSRVALNLSGIEKDDLARGMVVTRPGALRATSVLSARIEMLRAASDGLAQNEAIKVHAGTAEVMAQVSLLEGSALDPGAAAWAQLRLAEPLAVVVGDRFVIRRPSPSETLGGGTVADISGERLRRRRESVATLERRAAPSADSRLLAALDVPRTAEEAGARSGLDAAERDAAVAALVADGRVVALADALVAREGFEAFATHLERALAAAHRRAPLRAGAPREELRSSLGLPPKRFNALTELLMREGRVAERGSALALPSHVAALTPAQEACWARARTALAREPLQPPSPSALETEFGLDRELVAALGERGDLIRIGTEAVFLPEAVARFADAVIAELEVQRTITVARARDLTGSSRKHVLPLLQLLDDHGLTRRAGDDRILVVSPEQARERIATLTARKKVAQ